MNPNDDDLVRYSYYSKQQIMSTDKPVSFIIFKRLPIEWNFEQYGYYGNK